MKTAKVFQCGNSQALRIPQEFQFRGKEVEISRRGDEIILREKPQNLGIAFDLLTSLSEDFFSQGRKDTPPQKREAL